MLLLWGCFKILDEDIQQQGTGKVEDIIDELDEAQQQVWETICFVKGFQQGRLHQLALLS